MSDGVSRGVLLVIAALLAFLAFRPQAALKLQWDGPIQSGGPGGIPLAMNMAGIPYGKYDIAVVSDSQGIVITRIDRASGHIQVYRLDSESKMKLVDEK